MAAEKGTVKSYDRSKNHGIIIAGDGTPVLLQWVRRNLTYRERTPSEGDEISFVRHT